MKHHEGMEPYSWRIKAGDINNLKKRGHCGDDKKKLNGAFNDHV
jgi:hypothetical protein